MTSAAKVLQFPLAGLAKDQDYRKAYIPSEGAAFATPYAVNVIGECSFGERKRGGSRPGLKILADVSEQTTGDWAWPNGDKLCWSGADLSRIIFDVDRTIIAPDGSVLFDPHATFTVQAAKGAVPTGCTAMAKYRARLVVAKETMWYASRQGDITDFDYGGDGDDIGRAVAGNAALADAKGETITAIAAIEDQYLIVATNRSLRVLNGEPTSGEWSIASEYTGIVGRDAWCWDGNAFYFLGQKGMYALVPGENVVKKVSGRLPEDLKGLDADAILVSDHDKIHIIANRGETPSDWIYEKEESALWPVSYPETMRPELGAMIVIGGYNRVIFKCADGAWRYPDDDTGKDEGASSAADVPVASKVMIGPLRASARDDVDGMLAELTATMAEGSADVNINVYTAHSPEKAVANAKDATVTPNATFTVGEGWNRVWRPRTRGAWCVFVLSAEGRWAYESMTAVCKMTGRLR